jgi:release factor glutamine methyltransferase
MVPCPLSADDHDVVIDRLRSAGCVFAEDEAALLMTSADDPEHLARLVQRRIGGEPLEQVVGWARFCDLRIGVAPRVFVPRRRTEFLVHRAVQFFDKLAAGRQGPVLTVVELCCGSGAIGLALADVISRSPTKRPRRVEWHGVDLDPVAVRCAEDNLAAVSAALPPRFLDGRIYQGDLFEPLPARLPGYVDLLLANTPYVPTAELHLLPAEARLHEPRHALDGGPDGLDLLRRIASAATDWLISGGHLLIEISDRQAPAATEAFTAAGLVPGLVSSADQQATVVSGRQP